MDAPLLVRVYTYGDLLHLVFYNVTIIVVGV